MGLYAEKPIQDESLRPPFFLDKSLFERNPSYRLITILQDPKTTLDGVREALDAGADVDCCDSWCQTPLHLAAKYNADPEIIKLLVSYGADVNAAAVVDNTPLHHAARHNRNPAVVTTLIRAGAVINALNKANQTPLHLAAGFGCSSEVARPLIDVRLKEGEDILFFISTRDRCGRTQLCMAGINSNQEVGREILKMLEAKFAEVLKRTV